MINSVFPFLARLAIPVGRICLFVLFGATASLAWLFQFLRMDKLPEPIKMVVKYFFLGVLITIPVFAAEYGLSKADEFLNLPPLLHSFS